MDVIGRLRYDWRAEIMQRSGEAGLYIYGRVAGSHQPTREFFAELLKHSWRRVYELEVDVADSSLFDISLWDVFWNTAAPNLRHFRVELQGLSTDLSAATDPDRTLFSNDAPLLQTFKGSQLGFKSYASWISQLRNLNLSWPLATFEVLHALNCMPNLEHLALGRRILPLDSAQRPRNPHDVHLPSLKKISVENTFQTCTEFLSCIIPGVGISELTFVAMNSFAENPITIMDVESYKLAFAVYVQRSLSTVRIKQFGLRLWSNVFGLHLQASPSKYDVKSIVDITISGAVNIEFTEQIQNSFLETASTFDLSSTTDFSVTSDSSYPIGQKVPILSVIVEQLVSTESVFVDIYGLRIFSNVPLKGDAIVLPSLKTLMLSRFDSQMPLDFEEIISTFMSRRRRFGIWPITLDISCFMGADVINWMFLDEYENLTIWWRQGPLMKNYRCGSGTPHKLDFSRNGMPYDVL